MKELQGDIEEPKEGDWQWQMVKDAALLDFSIAMIGEGYYREKRREVSTLTSISAAGTFIVESHVSIT